MIDFLKDHLDILVVAASGLVWGGKLAQRVTALESTPSSNITMEMCDERHQNCKQLQSREIKHLEKEFDELKELISRLEQRAYDQGKAHGERHTVLVAMIKDLQKG